MLPKLCFVEKATPRRRPGLSWLVVVLSRRLACRNKIAKGNIIVRYFFR